MLKYEKIYEAVILLRIPEFYRSGMPAQELYEATRHAWKVGVRRDKAEYAFAIFEETVKEIYRIKRWHEAGTLPYKYPHIQIDQEKYPNRWEFEGEVADEKIRKKYLNKFVEHHARNPVRYKNC